MPRPKGEAEAIAIRRDAVTDGLLRGESMRAMAKRMGVAHTTVERDVQAVHDVWAKSAGSKLQAFKQREVERHSLIIKEAWQQWEQSKKPAVKRTAGRSGENEVDTTTEASQCGDPRYLQTIQKSSDSIAKLLGLHATEKHAHDFSGPAPGEADIFSMLQERIGSRI